MRESQVVRSQTVPGLRFYCSPDCTQGTLSLHELTDRLQSPWSTMATSIPVTNSLNRTTTLPDGADCVLGDQGIGCQERQFMLDGLANQYAVKWVAVKQWQL